MRSKKQSVDLAGLLKVAGPMLSSEAAGLLQRRGLQAAAARQRVSRLPADAAVLKGISFPKRKRFIYHKDDAGTGRYFRALETAIHAESPPLSMALRALEARGGMMPIGHFMIACGSPIRQKGQVSAERALAYLTAANLIRKVDIAGFGECLVRGGMGSLEDDAQQMRGRIAAESFLLDAMTGWLGRMNMVSPGAVNVRSDVRNPAFSTFEFDLCGPSYLAPLVHIKNGKANPGFMVADVILGRELGINDVAPFLRKCALLSNVKGGRPFLPMLIGDGFDKDALHRCRGAGIVATRAESLFGRDVAIALGSLLEVLSNTVAAPAERLDFILRRLGAVEGAAGNLRGALFEMVVSHMVTEIEGGSASVGRLLSSPEGKRAEIDVLLTRQKRVTCYECKGHQATSKAKATDVGRWLSESVPTAYSALKQENSEVQLRFEYWTCGEFEPDALALLADASDGTRRYEIAWKSGSEIKAYASGLAAQGVRKHLTDHFFAHPVSKALGSHTPQKRRN